MFEEKKISSSTIEVLKKIFGEDFEKTPEFKKIIEEDNSVANVYNSQPVVLTPGQQGPCC